MHRIRLAVVALLLAMPVTAMAQRAAQGKSGETQASPHEGKPTPEAQLKFWTEKLDLTADQQAKIKPVLQDLHDFTEKVMEDQSLTPEERQAKLKPARMQAHQQMMGVLTDDQKKKVEEYMKGPHPEMHEDQRGAKSR